MENDEKITFVALDGEGITVNSKHYYNLLLIRNEKHNLQYEMLPRPHQRELKTEDILTRLSTLRRFHQFERGHRFVYVMYYFNYDITMWLKDWPASLKEKLWNTGYAVCVYGRRKYRIHYIPNKLFRIDHQDIDGQWRKVVIYDVFGFFQTSFIKALVNWNIASESELESMDAMKKARSNFAHYDQQSIIEYCTQECGFLCQLMEKVHDAFLSENIQIPGWYGAGAVGQAILEREQVKSVIQSPYYVSRLEYDVSLDNAIMSAYFGGRFELMRQGIVKETYQYDINSAYPHAMLSIPDFSHMTIDIVEEYDETEPFALWYVTYDIRKGREKVSPLFGPLPYRTKSGNVVFPFFNSDGVWVHACELSAAIKLYGRHSFTIHCGYIFNARGRYYYPFSFISEMAERRLILKRAKDNRNIVLKLALNSLYGKMAQAIGGKDKIPPFQNYYLAGYVTAHCRAKVLEIGWSCGEAGSDVIQFATDGVFSISPSKLLGKKSSENLGEWEYSYHNIPICYLQAGIYFAKGKGTGTKRRTRGFAAKRLSAETVFEAWTNLGPGGQINAADTRFIGIGSSVATKKWEDYGTWKTVPHEINLLPPSGKQYLFESGYRIYGIQGNSMGEISGNDNDYHILVPWNESDKLYGPSLPYPHRHQHDIDLRYADLDSEILETIKQEINDAEQPDYERWRGFGDMETVAY